MIIVFIVSVVLSVHVRAADWGKYKQAPRECQILDKALKPVYEIGQTYVFSGDLGGEGRTSLMETDADWEFAYFKDVLFGDIDISLSALNVQFLDTADVTVDLPRQLTSIEIDVGWTWRSADGVACQLRVAPGIYSTLEEVNSDLFMMPFSCSMIRSFAPDLSGVIGVEIRPGFERSIIPIIGLEWEANEVLRVSARLPEARVTCFFARDWSSYLGLDWQSMSYLLHDGRDLVTMEDFRAYLGVSYRVSYDFRITAEVGGAIDRSLKFDPPDDSTTIGDAMFMRFALGGPF